MCFRIGGVTENKGCDAHQEDMCTKLESTLWPMPVNDTRSAVFRHTLWKVTFDEGVDIVLCNVKVFTQLLLLWILKKSCCLDAFEIGPIPVLLPVSIGNHVVPF